MDLYSTVSRSEPGAGGWRPRHGYDTRRSIPEPLQESLFAVGMALVQGTLGVWMVRGDLHFLTALGGLFLLTCPGYLYLAWPGLRAGVRRWRPPVAVPGAVRPRGPYRSPRG